jgi:hypothetical protein
MKSETVEAAATAASQAASQVASGGLKAAVAGGATLTFGGWTSNDVAMIGGLLLGLIGLLVQIHFKRKAHQLLVAEHAMRKEEHDARMAELA